MPVVTATRYSGTIQTWLPLKGIGFLKPNHVKELSEKHMKEIMFHHSEIKKKDESTGNFITVDLRDKNSTKTHKRTISKTIQTGQTVEFRFGQDPTRRDKTVAVDVTGEGGSELKYKEDARDRSRSRSRRRSGSYSSGNVSSDKRGVGQNHGVETTFADNADKFLWREGEGRWHMRECFR